MCDTTRQRKEEVKGAVVDAQKDRKEKYEGRDITLRLWMTRRTKIHVFAPKNHMRIM